MTRYNLTWSLQPSRVEGLSHIRMSVSWNKSRCRTTFLLGYSIDPSKWVKESSRVKVNTTHGKCRTPAYAINRQMDLYEDSVCKVMSSLDNPSVADMRRSFLSSTGAVTDESELVSHLWLRWMQEQERNSAWSDATIKKYKTAYNKMLVMFPDLTIDRFTKDTIQQWCNTLTLKGEKNSTIHRSLQVLKTFLRWCRSNGLYNGDAYLSNIRLRGARDSVRNIVYLTWDELMAVWNVEGLSAYHRRVRDIFCFMCFTSLRFSDVKSLRKSDIFDGKIHITIHKTSESVVIELNKYSKEILDRYVNDDIDYALPVISNQKMNSYIKVIAERAGVTSMVGEVWYNGTSRHERQSRKCDIVSCHTGRHTFIVNALSMGIPPSVVMKWTGHSNWSSMKPYVDIVDSVKEDSMKLFNR